MVKRLYTDENWLVINKPTGLSSQAAFAGDVGVEEWVRLNWGEGCHIPSRLDKGTSGVMVLARHPRAARQGEEWHRAGVVHKEYIFLSKSDARRKTGVDSWTIATPIGGKSAETRFEKIGPAGEFFLYRAVISKGRLHQIRRHAKESGIAILGDTEYGGASFPRLALHCKSVTWPGFEKPFQAPVPPSLGSLGDFKTDPGFLASFDRRLTFYEGITDAFRLVHRGEMRSLDAAIDFYGGFLCVWVYEEKMSVHDVLERLDPHLKKLRHVYGSVGGVVKLSHKNPHARGLVNESVNFGEKPPPYFEVHEQGLAYRVTLTEDQHVGLFLDQRDNRQRVRNLAEGARVANLFSYTCSFSVAAAKGGCATVFSVDAAAPCLETGRSNFELNKLSGGVFLKRDVRDWLGAQRKKVAKEGVVALFDIVICDPPTFSTTRVGGAFSVAQEWELLAEGVRGLLKTGGTAFFSTNHREADSSAYRRPLEKCFSEVLTMLPPLDFPVTDQTLETVKLFLCRA